MNLENYSIDLVLYFTYELLCVIDVSVNSESIKIVVNVVDNMLNNFDLLFLMCKISSGSYAVSKKSEEPRRVGNLLLLNAQGKFIEKNAGL